MNFQDLVMWVEQDSLQNDQQSLKQQILNHAIAQIVAKKYKKYVEKFENQKGEYPEGIELFLKKIKLPFPVPSQLLSQIRKTNDYQESEQIMRNMSGASDMSDDHSAWDDDTYDNEPDDDPYY